MCCSVIFTVLSVNILRSEARIFYQNVTLVYGSEEASVEALRLRTDGFGFANTGTLEFHATCPLQEVGSIWYCVDTRLSVRDRDVSMDLVSPIYI